MKTYDYNVELDTELGKKNGTMQLCVRGGRVNGFLSLLKHTEPLCGKIGADGSCELEGKVVTLMKEIAYIAKGRIRSDGLLLNMRLGAANCLLTGISRQKKKEVRENEQDRQPEPEERRKTIS